MKLVKTIVFVAVSVFAAQAFAGQSNGRDSVYAAGTTTISKSQSANAAASPRGGRDSVYATGKPVTSAPVRSASRMTERFGRV